MDRGDRPVAVLRRELRGALALLPHTLATWYEPLEAQDDIDLAVWWALARPGAFVNSVGDVDLLPRVLDAASRFADAPEESAMSALAERSAAETLFV